MRKPNNLYQINFLKYHNTFSFSEWHADKVMNIFTPIN